MRKQHTERLRITIMLGNIKISQKGFRILVISFLILWTGITGYLNYEHQKDINLLSKVRDITYGSMHKSDEILSAYVTQNPQIQQALIEDYKDQLVSLITIQKELNSLWPNTPKSVVYGIEDLLKDYKKLNSDRNSLINNHEFSASNVYLKDVAYREYVRAKKDRLHQNMPLFLILALSLVIFSRYVDRLKGQRFVIPGLSLKKVESK